jgi:hypothetical protein
MNFYPIMEERDVPYPVGSDMKPTLRIVDQMVQQFRRIYHPREKIALLIRGSSGAIMAGLFTAKLPEYDFEIVLVRKPEERHHGGNSITHLPYDRKAVIIDDFMASGDTINRIHSPYCNYEIDTLILSGTVRAYRLNFVPKNVIAGNCIRDEPSFEDD